MAVPGARRARPQDGRVPVGAVVAVACTGAFLAFLDATIVNVAFPSIRASFPDSGVSSLSWVLNSYNITFAALLVVCGRLADLLGRRRVFVLGVGLFTLASVACGLAGSLEVLVVARVAQAVGAALLVPASLALVVEAAPADRRAHAVGLWGASSAVAAGLGPPLGGALVQAGGWRWAFLVNLPLGVLAVVVARRTLVESRAPGRRRLPDLRGAALLTGGVALLNLAIVQGGDWGWSSPRVLGSVAASALLLGALVGTGRRHPEPLLDPALLRLRAFGLAGAATVFAGFGFFAYLLCNVLWLTSVWQYGVLRAGLAVAPGALVAAVVAARLGPLAERRGYRVVAVPGALVWALAYVWYHQRVGVAPAFLSQWLPGQVLSGIGVGATLPVLGSAALAAVPGGRFATASAVVSSARQLGGVLGIAVLVALVGTPTPTTVVAELRSGWLLSVGAFLAVAALSLPLGRVARDAQQEASTLDAPRLLLPPRQIELPDARPGLARVGLFAQLPLRAARRLEALAQTVDVGAGEVLVREGEPGGSAFLVQRGRLLVTVGGRPVRELGPGAVLGELSVLTGEPRSATVTARRDSTLLEVTGEDFGALLEGSPASARAVARQLAGRLRDPGATSARPVRPAVVAVVGREPAVRAAAVAEALRSASATTRRVVRLTRIDPEAVEAAERDGALVLLVAEAHEAALSSWCVRTADQVVLVARGDTPPGALPPSPDRPGVQPDLVLLGPRPGPARLADWASAVDAWQVTCAGEDLPAALRPLADRLLGRSVGLVLAGGGARAFAHVGVLRELEEAGVRVDRVAGCSVGAAVAAAWASGMDGAALDAACYEEFVRRRPFSDLTVPTVALARGRRVQQALERRFGADTRVEGLPRQFSCVSVDLVSRRRVEHRRGTLATAVRGSLGLPVLLPPVRDEGRLLVDGGVLDNLPVDLLTARDEGPVVAVHIAMGGGGAQRDPHRPPRVPALGETLLRSLTIGSGGAVQAALAQGVPVLTPGADGVGLLEFHQFDRMVASGRRAARALLEATGGDLRAPAVLPQPRAETGADVRVG